MQIYTDITGREIKVSSSRQASASGATMFGAIAAGSEAAGGYNSIEDAITHMASIEKKIYFPIPENVKAYTSYLLNIKNYMIISGRGINQVMERLKK